MHFFTKLLLTFSITAISVKAQTCWIPAKCKEGIPVDLTVTKSHEECLKHCQDTFNCKWFTFDESQESCILFSECSKWDDTCSSCTSGEQGCSVRQIKDYCLIWGSCLSLYFNYLGCAMLCSWSLYRLNLHRFGYEK